MGNSGPREEDRIQRQFEQLKQFKKEGKSNSSWLSSYNKFNILATCIIQADILGLEESVSKKDKKTILREEKMKE